MPDQLVTSSVMLWSEVVARANAAEGEVLTAKEPAYEFPRHTFVQPDELYLNAG